MKKKSFIHVNTLTLATDQIALTMAENNNLDHSKVYLSECTYNKFVRAKAETDLFGKS